MPCKNYALFFDKIKNAPQSQITKLKRAHFALGKMKKEWVDGLKKEGVVLQSDELIQRGDDIIHATRPNKRKKIEEEWWQELPQRLETPDAAVLDITKKNEPVLLLVFQGENGFAKKLTIQLNKQENGDFVNIVRTGGLVSPQGLDGKNYILVSGVAFWKKTKK